MTELSCEGCRWEKNMNGPHERCLRTILNRNYKDYYEPKEPEKPKLPEMFHPAGLYGVIEFRDKINEIIDYLKAIE